jgi:hypothetical protein
MHPKNKPPIFVPGEYQAEMDRLSKAALMDLVWGLVVTAADTNKHDAVIAEIRKHAAHVVTLREQD